jgi:WD40 repeat protein
MPRLFWTTAVGSILLLRGDKAPLPIQFDSPDSEIIIMCLFDNGSKLASGGYDEKVYLWDLSNRKVTKSINAKWSVRTLAVSPNNEILAIGTSFYDIFLYDLQKGKWMDSLSGHGMPISSLVFSNDGRTLFSCSRDMTIRVWDVAKRKEIKTLEGHKDAVYGLALSPDGKKLVSASHDRSLILWDLNTLKSAAVLEGHKGVVLSATFSPDGKQIISGGFDKKLIVWDVETKKPVLSYDGENRIRCLKFIPKSPNLILGSEEGWLVHFDPRGGKILKKIQGHKDAVTSLQFQSDGKTFYSSSFDKRIKEWSSKVFQDP